MDETLAVVRKGSPIEVFLVALRLGVTSFGGPIAHLGYFRNEYVVRRAWLSDHEYGELVALCQFLPGPASSQVGMAVGMKRAGLVGGFAAWLGFTAPSAAAMIAFGYGVNRMSNLNAGWIHGLMVVSFAVVAQAVWGMASRFCRNRLTQTLAILAAVATLAWPQAFAQVALLGLAALAGWRLLPAPEIAGGEGDAAPHGRRTAVSLLAILALLLVGLPLTRVFSHRQPLELFAGFFQAGALVFGGGHVVVPLLKSLVVDPGWLTPAQFVAGNGAVQAVPGPLFTFAAYLGTVERPNPNGWLGGLIALVAIFLPSYLFIGGALPFWGALRRRPAVRSAIQGLNAAVVGLLLAALYTPIATSAIQNRADFGLAVAAFGLLAFWKAPAWMVVLFGAASGAALGRL